MHELELLCTRCAQERWLLIRATPLRNGRSGMVISHLDITARKQAEVAIQNSKQEWEATFDAVDSMVILTDPNGAITRLNRATCDRLCSAFKELIGLTIAQVFFGEHPYNPELFRSGSDAVQLPNLPGWFSIACYPLQVAGISAGWVNILTDISQKKETMDALERNARELETLYRTSLEINAQQDLNLLLNIIVEQATKLANANVGGLYLYRPEEDEMELVVGHNYETNLIGTCLKRGEGLSGRVLESGEAMMIPDYSAWEGRSSYYNQNLTRRVLAVPMKIGARVIGAINVSDKQRIGLFSEEEIRLVSLMADQAANAVENTRLLAEVRRELAARIAAEARLQRQFRRLAGLRALDAAITTGLELRLIMNLLLVQTRSQLEVDAADVLLLSNDLQTLELTAGEGFDPDMERQQQMNHGEGLAWQSVFRRSRVALDLPVERHNGNPYARQMAGEGFIAYISVPLVAKGQVKGVLEVFQRGPLAPEQEWLEYLETLAGQGAIAIDNAEMFTGLQRSNLELQAAYEATIEGWSQALELRDKETKGHSDRVTRLTEQLAIAMGIKGEALLQFRHGVRLHDIGKMGIPDSILLKPGPLTDEEWIVMRQHPVYAYNLLKGIPYLEKAIEIPYSHHEKWDGSGYPRGLKGEEIPLSARIFSVVDVWDALVSDRPYRKAWTAQAACEYLQAQVNIHFDPQVVATFLPMIQHVQI
jgi:HD-GYP domain-containing protein (c-di-GMP phosphodiesterase class II)